MEIIQFISQIIKKIIGIKEIRKNSSRTFLHSYDLGIEYGYRKKFKK